ncbi:anti-sigma factor [Plastoroseomonas arctica]|uniref:RNA polymerase subunit sigma-70 n=1 Tax=Plastoroseomonas arctica TaxID=1509237 RepID=A0AAF1KMG2_9PROT|nr:anti-sigma factor [Plastoroseomonas arctica]MBR0656366.1 RNA polymerase subunit sigma-70 [Plastoroseomonas arctica]
MSATAMTPEERQALAAEYVLGTLDAATVRMVALAAALDPVLADEIADWEMALAPLQDLATPEAPPPELWDRIAGTLEPAAAPLPARRKASWFWPAWSFGATVVAGSLAAILLVRPPAPAERMMTVLLSSRDQPAWVVEADRAGLRLAALNPRAAPADRAMQLWALPQGATAPTSLGLIPRESGEVRVSASQIRPEPGMLIEITLEPPGGSPTGRPTGPVLFIGRLSPATGT